MSDVASAFEAKKDSICHGPPSGLLSKRNVRTCRHSGAGPHGQLANGPRSGATPWARQSTNPAAANLSTVFLCIGPQRCGWIHTFHTPTRAHAREGVESVEATSLEARSRTGDELCLEEPGRQERESQRHSYGNCPVTSR